MYSENDSSSRVVNEHIYAALADAHSDEHVH